MSDMVSEDRLRPQWPAPASPDLGQLPRTRLEAMRAAGAEVLECLRVLDKADLDLVSEVLRGQGTFYELEHYPSDDVFDRDTHAQYYYHAHRGAGEHGHFHTFLRAPGMPERVAPAPYSGEELWPRGDESISHLIAISMDAFGQPISLFAVNRWVSAEAWYPAEDVIRMLDRFAIDHAFPSWPVNRWIGAMLQLFRPQVEALVRHRDTVVDAWRRAHPDSDVFEDRRLDVTGEFVISIDAQIAAVEAALAR
ncbi:MAG: hypothetical protein Q8Q16_03115 [Betaproteobacteria bacterium]|nr:hypothetical protein [Betaproteobacteria bacterium]